MLLWYEKQIVVYPMGDYREHDKIIIKIITEEEYTELFGTESDDETFYRDLSGIRLESTEEISKAQSVGDDSIEAAESDGSNEGGELQERTESYTI